MDTVSHMTLFGTLWPSPEPPCFKESLACTPSPSPLNLMARQFKIARPCPADAPQIAKIHLEAMESNPLLHAQFPTSESLDAARQFLAAYTEKQLASDASGVLVARDPESDAVVGFVKWDSPSHPEVVKVEGGELREISGCRPEFLDGYVALAEEAMKRSFGDRACYRECFTSPHLAGFPSAAPIQS